MLRREWKAKESFESGSQGLPKRSPDSPFFRAVIGRIQAQGHYEPLLSRIVSLAE